MKGLILGFIFALVLLVLVYGVPTFLPQLGLRRQGPLYDNDVKKAQSAVICDAIKHSCRYFEKTPNSGNVRVVINAGSNPVKNLEVDVAPKPGAPQYYVKLTDKQGVALFENLPSGQYAIYFNGVNFPKEYGDSPTVPIEIIKEQTKEIFLPLTPSPGSEQINYTPTLWNIAYYATKPSPKTPFFGEF